MISHMLGTLKRKLPHTKRLHVPLRLMLDPKYSRRITQVKIIIAYLQLEVIKNRISFCLFYNKALFFISLAFSIQDAISGLWATKHLTSLGKCSFVASPMTTAR